MPNLIPADAWAESESVRAVLISKRVTGAHSGCPEQRLDPEKVLFTAFAAVQSAKRLTVSESLC